MEHVLNIRSAVKCASSGWVIHRGGGAAYINIVIGIQSDVGNGSVRRKSRAQVEVFSRSATQMRGVSQHWIDRHRQGAIIFSELNAKLVIAEQLPVRVD